MSRRAVLVFCALPVVLLSSCANDADGAGSSSSSVERQSSATTRTNDPASDAKALSALLGPTTPSCPEGVPSTNVTCGELLASSAKLVDIVDVALDSMPNTEGYTQVTEAVASFQKAYGTIRSTGCYTPQPVGGVSDEFCHGLAGLVSLAWLHLSAQIDALGRMR